MSTTAAASVPTPSTTTSTSPTPGTQPTQAPKKSNLHASGRPLQAQPAAQPTKSTPQGQAAPKADPKATQAAPAEEFEEIKLGGAQGKVPKQLATAIKELERGMQARFQEAATIKKQFNDFAQAAKANPDLFFKQFGVDPDQYTQARLAQKLQREMMSPDQRKSLELEEENRRLKADNETRAQQEKVQRERVEYEQADRQNKTQMLDSWKKSGLPEDPRFLSWMAATMRAAVLQQKPLTWDQVADIVKRDYWAHSKRTVSSLTPQQLEEYLGPDALKKWREFDVARVANPTAQASNSPGQGRPAAKAASQSKNAKKPALTESQWKNWRESGLPLSDWMRTQGKGG